MLLFHLLVFLCDVRQPNSLKAVALGHDAIVESDIGTAAAQLMHFKSLRGLVAHIEAFAIAPGSEEYVVLHVGVHCLGEGRIEHNVRGPAGELSGAGILEPVLRGLCRIERHLLRTRRHYT